MKTILFPTDFSNSAVNALNYAIGICEALKAKLILFNSVSIPAIVTQPSMNMNMEEQLIGVAKEDILLIKNTLIANNKDIDIECFVNYGEAINNIISLAAERHADIIIMGTKGASGLKEVFLGTNTAAVLEKAPCPVLVIPEKVKFKNINKIVFATDLKDNDFHTIAALTEIALSYNAEILVVHISEFMQTDDYEKKMQEWFENGLKESAEIQYKNISFHHLIGGNIDWELERFIEENDIDLLSLSMRKRTVFTKLFSPSLTKKMAYHASVPLMVFHAS
ncbi:MAG: universal stress protein [Bacteroidia bacterium]